MYPLTYEADYEQYRNRVLTALRPILVLPWLVVGAAYLTAALLTAVICWVVILVIGRYPSGFYAFMAGFLRFQARVQGWATLQTDDWPSLGIEEARDYPVMLEVEEPPARFSRLRALIRPITAIPVLLASVPMLLLALVAAVASWAIIIVTGRQPTGLHNTLSFVNAYLIRGTGFAYLLTEALPPLSSQGVAPVLIEPAVSEAEAEVEPERVERPRSRAERPEPPKPEPTPPTPRPEPAPPTPTPEPEPPARRPARPSPRSPFDPWR
jgi:hypothetical protein